MSDVMVRGRFPYHYRRQMEASGVWPSQEEQALLGEGRLDFVAFSYYRLSAVGATGVVQNDALPVTPFGWMVDPEGIRSVLNEVYERYDLPVLVVENGLGTYDEGNGTLARAPKRSARWFRQLSASNGACLQDVT